MKLKDFLHLVETKSDNVVHFDNKEQYDFLISKVKSNIGDWCDTSNCYIVSKSNRGRGTRNGYTHYTYTVTRFTDIEFKEESIFRIAGKKLPIITYGTEYITSLIYYTCKFSNSNEEQNIHLDSNGIFKRCGKEYISAKSKGSPSWEGLYLFKESDLIKLAEEQGIEWRVNNNSNKTNMEKKIKEYRVKDKYNKASRALFEFAKPDIYGGYGSFDHNSKLVKFYKDEQVLDLWFEPVYEEEVKFKIGDWVYILDTGFSIDGNINLRDVKKINSFFRKDKNKYQNYIFFEDGSFGGDNGSLNKFFRLATPEEIEAVSNKTINIGFDVKIKNKRAFVGNDDITEFIIDMIYTYNQTKSFGGFTVDLKDIIFKRTGCKSVETKLSDWKRIYDEIKPSSGNHPQAYAC